MINSNKAIQENEKLTLFKWNLLKEKKNREQTNTNYVIDKKEMKLKRRTFRRER